MRSLAAKLTLAFLLVGLTGAILVAVISRQLTTSAFDRFLEEQEQQIVAASVTQYLAATGDWNGVIRGLDLYFSAPALPFESARVIRQEWESILLVNARGEVIYSRPPGQVGERISERQLKQGVTLFVNGRRAGWLIMTLARRQWSPDSAEGLFLRNVTRAVRVSAVVAAALALFLGGLLAFTMTRSLRELKEATVDIARGKLGRQVKVRSRDEFGDLASSFNKMSLDLQRATQARRQMTADIAHDLRSPLTVISGYAEALSDGKLPGTPEVYQILYQEAEHLKRLVEDLRILSLADAGELPLNIQPVDPQALLERVAARHAIAAREHGITLKLEPGADLPRVSVDPERMVQVFDNLLNNAFRYTPPGGEIELSASQVDGTVQLRVKDTGSGISPEDLPRVFDRFYRGDKSRTRKEESGLGLAIVKSIVELQGGSISVDSAPGKGAVFTVGLPFSGYNNPH